MVTAGMLNSVPLFAGLPAEQLATLASGVTVRKVPRGTFVMRAGDGSDGLYVILSGRAKVLIPDAEGREVILATIGRHEFFGDLATLDDHSRSASVRTLEPCELLCVSKADFMRCLSHNCELAMRIVRELVRRLRESDRQIESLALIDVHGRVARVLLDLAEDIDGKRVIDKAPPKQEIAHMIGASREMVSRVMRDLQNSGHVCIDKRRIVLLGK